MKHSTHSAPGCKIHRTINRGFLSEGALPPRALTRTPAALAPRFAAGLRLRCVGRWPDRGHLSLRDAGSRPAAHFRQNHPSVGRPVLQRCLPFAGAERALMAPSMARTWRGTHTMSRGRSGDGTRAHHAGIGAAASDRSAAATDQMPCASNAWFAHLQAKTAFRMSDVPPPADGPDSSGGWRWHKGPTATGPHAEALQPIRLEGFGYRPREDSNLRPPV